MEGKRSYHLLWIAITASLISLLLGRASGQNNVPVAHAAPIAHVIPGQFIAKIYTEALGRMPTQAEWQFWADTFTNSLDCEQTVKDTVYQFYTGPDFLRCYPDTEPGKQREAQLLALSRGALNEEIAQYWFNFMLRQMARTECVSPLWGRNKDETGLYAPLWRNSRL